MRHLLSVVLLVLCSARYVEAAEPTKPRLVVLIVVDQFRADYLDALGGGLLKGGFDRLARDGAYFTNAVMPYGVTATGPGHASIGAGTTPSVHGIVGNDWIDIEHGNRAQYCCGDDRERIVGLDEADDHHGRSPRLLCAPTIGEALKTATHGQAHVWGISLKDRAAILPAGRGADGAIWWASSSGRFVSSSYYGLALPAWAQKLNDDKYVDTFFHTKWDRLLPPEAYRAQPVSGRLDPEAYRRYHANTFPKEIGDRSSRPDKAYYADLFASPFGNQLVFEAARRVIKAESLGADDTPDLLTISLSSNDVVGHFFGPESDEVLDCTLRTDRQLEAFFTWLDAEVGLRRCVVALTSDHGVAPIPEYTEALGLGGGRLKSKEVESFVEAALRARVPSRVEGPFVRDVMLPWLWLNGDKLQAAGISVDDASRLAADALMSHEGIAKAFAAKDILALAPGRGNDLARYVRNSSYPGRSGHVYIHWQRYWYKSGGNRAGHGAAYDYDQRVPVFLMGSGIRPGRYTAPVSPAGIAAVLCRLAGIDSPETMVREAYTQALVNP